MFQKKFLALCVKGQLAYEGAKEKMKDFGKDIAGSDTTEKIGMVVVAIVIVGLLATAANKFMPTFFNDIFTTAQEKLDKIFESGKYGS